jgi:hypothetical protein
MLIQEAAHPSETSVPTLHTTDCRNQYQQSVNSLTRHNCSKRSLICGYLHRQPKWFLRPKPTYFPKCWFFPSTVYCAIYCKRNKHNLSRSFTSGCYTAAQNHATLKSVQITLQVRMITILVFKMQNIKNNELAVAILLIPVSQKSDNCFRSP